jgi:hypothetical protein
LEKLRTQLVDGGEVFPILPCRFPEIQPFAVLLRYDVTTALDEADRKRFTDTVDILREWIVARIAVLSV